jgi:hypothetical protein
MLAEPLLVRRLAHPGADQKLSAFEYCDASMSGLAP